jgi:cytochrome c-type biogenesis protein CcmH/NrfG
MKKENVVILLIVTFIVGFVAGAVGGIKFYSREDRQGQPATQAEATPPAASAEEVNRLEAIVAREPRNLQALVALGNLYFDSKHYQKAIDTYLRALAIDPKNADVLTDLGIMYRAAKEYDKAILEFREAARLDPTHKNSRFNLAVVLQYDTKDVNGAIAAWEDFLKVEPTGARADAVRGEIQKLKGLALSH